MFFNTMLDHSAVESTCLMNDRSTLLLFLDMGGRRTGAVTILQSIYQSKNSTTSLRIAALHSSGRAASAGPRPCRRHAPLSGTSSSAPP